MRELSVSAALRETLARLLREHPEALLIGEDIGVYGGAFKVTAGFVDEFGRDRVIDTPISEAGFVSVAAGAALMGSHPIVEIMFMDFMALAFDGIINVAAKWREIYGPEFAMPLIIRAPAGAGRSYGPTHSQSFEGVLMNVPGVSIVCPATPADAAGLLLGAYAHQGLVIFIEPKALYARKGPVPETVEPIPLGKGHLVRAGQDLTLISYGRQLAATLAAADLLAKDGLSAEVVDLRCLKPLDRELLVQSVSHTGRGLCVEETPVCGGVGAEVAALIMEEAFTSLEAPFARLGAAEQAIPCAPALERACFPTPDSIAAKALALCNY